MTASKAPKAAPKTTDYVVQDIGLAGWGLARQMDHLADDLPTYRVNILAKIADVRGVGKGGSVEKLQQTIEGIKTDLGQSSAPRGRASRSVVVTSEPVGGFTGFSWLGPIVGPLGTAGLVLAMEKNPELILLDIMLPRVNGYEVCRSIRERGLEMPILMLTAKGQEEDIVLGLNLGADDYITKPFSVRELMARIRAVLRRPGPRQKFEEFAFGDVRVHLRARQAFKAGREVRLTRKEFDLLRYLVEHPGEVITRDRLLDEVWGYDRFPTTRTVDTHILRLRQKFEDDPERPAHIVTAHGQGYRFVTARGEAE